MKTDLLGFVRGRLEQDEGIAPEALARLLSVARATAQVRDGRHRPFAPRFQAKVAVLLAASLLVACCGWFVNRSCGARREADVSNVIALLSTADGVRVDEGRSLAETLVSWQDVPCEGVELCMN